MDAAMTKTTFAALGEAGGAIGVVCAVLLLCTFLFIRYLIRYVESRDAEIRELNNQIKDAMVNNASALTALTHVLNKRPCMAESAEELDRISKTVLKKKETL